VTHLLLVVLGLALGMLWSVCCPHLTGERRFNKQYSYGGFVAFFVAYLSWFRWDHPPEPERTGIIHFLPFRIARAIVHVAVCTPNAPSRASEWKISVNKLEFCCHAKIDTALSRA
jgi:hypothetical protein